jgi:hypothetical protein
MNRYRIALIVAGAATLNACSYEKNAAQDITAPISGANVKFFNFAVSAPSLNFFANDAKVTAVSSTSCSPPPSTPNPACNTTGVESTAGTAAGAVANGGLYNVVAPGSVTLAGKISATTDNGLAVASTTANLETGKYYTFFTGGIYDATAKKVDAFVLEDVLPQFDFANAYVRFVNASSNATASTLFAKNQTTGTEAAVGGAVAYKTGGTFVALTPGLYDVSVRLGSSSTNLVTLTNVSFAGGRVYTVSLRGDVTVTSTTAATRPVLQNNTTR